MIWLKIKGYENEYQISEKGDVRRITVGEEPYLVKSCVATNKKRYVTLWKNGERKIFMLHNVYAEAFQLPVKVAMRILYEGYEGNAAAKDRVRFWLLDKIHECEQESIQKQDLHDEILYLRAFLKQLSD